MHPKILSIDDSKTIRSIIRKMLMPYNCELLEAQDGLEGLQMAKDLDPDLIILDIDMPVMNGLEMLMNLRSDKQSKETPVFMLTSKSKEKNVRVSLKLGVKAFISKPFNREELIDRIQKVLPLSSR